MEVLAGRVDGEEEGCLMMGGQAVIVFNMEFREMQSCKQGASSTIERTPSNLFFPLPL